MKTIMLLMMTISLCFSEEMTLQSFAISWNESNTLKKDLFGLSTEDEVTTMIVLSMYKTSEKMRSGQFIKGFCEKKFGIENPKTTDGADGATMVGKGEDGSSAIGVKAVVRDGELHFLIVKNTKLDLALVQRVIEKANLNKIDKVGLLQQYGVSVSGDLQFGMVFMSRDTVSIEAPRNDGTADPITMVWLNSAEVDKFDTNTVFDTILQGYEFKKELFGKMDNGVPYGIALASKEGETYIIGGKMQRVGDKILFITVVSKQAKKQEEVQVILKSIIPKT